MGDRYMTRYGFPVDNPFPWRGAIYRFKDGECDMIASSSNPVQLTGEYEIKQVIFGSLTENQSKKMTERFATAGFEFDKIAA
jgi:hypothetical protein